MMGVFRTNFGTLQVIKMRLAELSTTFSNNVLDATKACEPLTRVLSFR